jgi:hypothetical protein
MRVARAASAATVGRHRREFLDITCPRRDWMDAGL